jgi:membrane protein
VPSHATATLITGLNVTYEEPEKRGMVWLQVVTLGLTLAVIVFALVAVLPAVIDLLPFHGTHKMIASLLRWPILVLLVMAALAVVYRYAPSRDEPRWRWVSWGAVLATILWIVGSALFSIYVGQFASYNKSYGSLGGVIVLLMWLYLSAFVILLGAEVNAEIEHQTARDTTGGTPQPMGRRGAKMADTLGAPA